MKFSVHEMIKLRHNITTNYKLLQYSIRHWHDLGEIEQLSPDKYLASWEYSCVWPQPCYNLISLSEGCYNLQISVWVEVMEYTNGHFAAKKFSKINKPVFYIISKN